jgi:hypothetical protein
MIKSHEEERPEAKASQGNLLFGAEVKSKKTAGGASDRFTPEPSLALPAIKRIAFSSSD